MAYHVAHPGGRAYDDFPVNPNAAEARGRFRFRPFGHVPGSSVMPLPRRGQNIRVASIYAVILAKPFLFCS
ncbi:transglutaminase family protein [Acidocella sp.]|uniref:transglutaminase family protein n=1 Tax=Acidocella sp. TaxID=50710 RepID=UPI002608406C|nr:transglutaminase family protein [Acidocella sp.]